MDIRLPYFRLMEDVIYELMCVNMQKEKFTAIERWTSIFLAVFSSAGVASWFLWEKYALYAACAIAIAQIVSIAMPFFEFRKRIEKLLIAASEMQKLSDQMQDLWPTVMTRLTDEEIEEKIATFRAKERQFLEPLQKDCRPGKKICEKAQVRVNEYSKSHFNQ